jgi:flavin reductase (DIM6/NTAB) family NADH-FMN oxidoreductase RutF
VDRIARTTGSDPVPEGKASRGYRYLRTKFEAAGMTPVASLTVKAPRAKECPVQLEATLEEFHPIADRDPAWKGRSLALQVAIGKVHAATDILADGEADRIDPDKWRPLIMSFQQFYGLAADKVHGSELAKIPEAAYRA